MSTSSSEYLNASPLRLMIIPKINDKLLCYLNIFLTTKGQFKYDPSPTPQPYSLKYDNVRLVFTSLKIYLLPQALTLDILSYLNKLFPPHHHCHIFFLFYYFVLIFYWRCKPLERRYEGKKLAPGTVLRFTLSTLF